MKIAIANSRFKKRWIVAVALALIPCHAAAADAAERYPSKPIRIVTGSTAGATPDVLARLIGAKLGESWKQPVVVDNRPGAGGVLAYNTVAKSTPDGYTLSLAAPSIAIQAAVSRNLPYDTLKDFAGVTEIGYSNVVVVVGPGLGVKSLKELVDFANARPGKVFNATGVVGGADHLTAERFKYFAGIKARHVSFDRPRAFQLDRFGGCNAADSGRQTDPAGAVRADAAQRSGGGGRGAGVESDGRASRFCALGHRDGDSPAVKQGSRPHSRHARHTRAARRRGVSHHAFEPGSA
jgi:tripartite-type tricarboxylate transporter receptor subunit TctC